MEQNKVDYEAEVLKVYPKAYGQWAMGHCVVTNGKGKSISDLIKGVNAMAQQESWKNAYERLVKSGKLIKSE